MNHSPLPWTVYSSNAGSQIRASDGAIVTNVHLVQLFEVENHHFIVEAANTYYQHTRRIAELEEMLDFITREEQDIVRVSESNERAQIISVIDFLIRTLPPGHDSAVKVDVLDLLRDTLLRAGPTLMLPATTWRLRFEELERRIRNHAESIDIPNARTAFLTILDGLDNPSRIGQSSEK